MGYLLYYLFMKQKIARLPIHSSYTHNFVIIRSQPVHKQFPLCCLLLKNQKRKRERDRTTEEESKRESEKLSSKSVLCSEFQMFALRFKSIYHCILSLRLPICQCLFNTNKKETVLLSKLIYLVSGTRIVRSLFIYLPTYSFCYGFTHFSLSLFSSSLSLSLCFNSFRPNTTKHTQKCIWPYFVAAFWTQDLIQNGVV